jgi:hypothetical protein
VTAHEPEPGDPLTPREVEVLAAYAVGGTQDAVAAALGISKQTVKNHLSYIYIKVGAACAIQAFRAVGWLTVPDAFGIAALAYDQRAAAARRSLRALRDAIDEALAAPVDEFEVSDLRVAR